MEAMISSSSNIVTNPDVDRINKSLKELKISHTVNHQETDRSCIAGTVSTVIAPLDTALIQPQSSNNLLYLGTPLFLKRTNRESSLSDYTLVGTIDDIFGPVCQPLYKVQITELPMNALNVGEEVYYLVDNSRTKHMKLERSFDRNTNRMRHRIRAIRKRKHQKFK